MIINKKIKRAFFEIESYVGNEYSDFEILSGVLKIGQIFEDEGKVDSSFLGSNYSSVTPVDIAITRDCWKTYKAERKINNWEIYN